MTAVSYSLFPSVIGCVSPHPLHPHSYTETPSVKYWEAGPLGLLGHESGALLNGTSALTRDPRKLSVPNVMIPEVGTLQPGRGITRT